MLRKGGSSQEIMGTHQNSHLALGMPSVRQFINQHNPSCLQHMVLNRKKRAIDRHSARTIAIWRESNHEQKDETCAFDQMLEAAPHAFALNSLLNTCHLCKQFVSPFKVKDNHGSDMQQEKEASHSVQPTLSFFMNLPGQKFTEEKKIEEGLMVQNDDKCGECLKVACENCKEQCCQCGKVVCKGCLVICEMKSSLGLVCEACFD